MEHEPQAHAQKFMDKHTHLFGTMDDLRKSDGKSDASFSTLAADERASMIGKILDHFGYANLNREDKGVVRTFLQSSTGYSRAQVARYISAHLQSVRYYRPEVISFVHNKWKRRMFPALTLTLLLLLSGAINHRATGDVLSVLNAERTTGTGNVVSGTARTMIVKTGDAQLLAIHEEPGETLVTWSLNALLQRVDARRIVRLRLNAGSDATNKGMAARPDIAIEKEQYPAVAHVETVHAAANDPWDIPASGVEGQILMIKNGKPVWRDFPYLEQIRTEAPHGTESTRRAGGSRSGGSENAVQGGTTTTTVIQQTGGASAPSGWTDGGAFVYLTDETATVGIGTETPDATLEVVGTISGTALVIGGSITGASLHIDGDIVGSSLNIAGSITGSSLYIGATIDGAGLTSCNSTTSKLVWNATTRQFECAIDQTVGTGLSQATGDERYLQKQGGVMTGALTIRVTGGGNNTVGLNVINTISGAVVHAQKSLTSSGTLVWEGAGSGSSLYIASSLQGAGLADCDLSTQKLQWDSTTGRFSCGTDVDTAMWSNTGALRTAFDTRYVNVGGDTMTGVLTVNITGGSQSAIGLKVINTLSGAVLHAEKSLTTSGTLAVEGAATVQGMLHVLQSNGELRLDAGGAGNTFTLSFYDGTQRASISNNQATATFAISTDNRLVLSSTDYINISGSNYVNINDIATVLSTGLGIGTTSPETPLEVVGIGSGTVLYASRSLRSSGSLVFEGAGSGSSLYIASSLQGAGLVDCDIAGTSKLLWDSSTGRFSCGTDTDTDTNTTYTAARGLTLNGTAFSLNSTITGALVRFTTISGSIITAKTSLASSGSLTWEGAASGATIWVSSFDGAGLTDCDLSTNKLLWDATLKRFSCSTDLNTAWSNTGSILTAADSKYVNIGGDTMTGTLVINPATSIALNARGTISGSSLLTLSNYRGCTLKTSATGAVICGTDNGTSYYAGQGLTLASNIFSLNSTITGALVRFTTISGSTIYAKNSLASSGSLTWEGAGSGSSLYIASSLQGVGLTDCDAASEVLKWDVTTGRFSCGTDLNSDLFSTGSILSAGDRKYVNIGGDTMTGTLTLTPVSGVALNARGTISGSSLTISSLSGCDTIDTDAQGNFVCGTDATGGSGSPEVGTSSFSGAVVRLGNTQWVKKAGDTMTGTLVINPATSIALNARGTLSGSSLLTLSNYRGCTLKTSATGAVICGTDNGTSYYAGQGLTLSSNVFTLNSTITGALVRFTTVSGSTIYAKNSLASSGSLTWEGAASGATIWVSSFDGAGLTDCDLSTNKLLWDATLKRFSCSTDLNTAWSNTGSILTAADSKYVNIGGDTMTGALAISVTGGSQNTLGLRVINTASGAHLHAEKTLSSSGTLVWEGAGSGSSLYIASSLQGAGLVDCDIAGTSKLLWDSSTGRFSCGTDTDTDTNTTYTAARGLTLNGTAFSLNSTITGALVRFTTVSGSTIYAKNSLASSGSLTWEGAGSGSSLWVSLLNVGSNINASGSILANRNITARGTISGALITQNGAGTNYFRGIVGIGTTAPATLFDISSTTDDADMRLVTTVGGSSKRTNITAGSGGEFRLDIDPGINGASRSFIVNIGGSERLRVNSAGNMGIGKSVPAAKLDVLGTISGSAIAISSLSNCDTIDTDAQGNFVCGTDATGGSGSPEVGTSSFSGAVVRLGNTQWVKKAGDTMTGALVINVTGGNINSVGLEVINTISGSVLHANTLLRSSGSLVTESGAYIDGTTLVVAAGPNRVGIGTASPKTALEVLGTISGSLITQNGAGNNYFLGNVGIGDTNPGVKLVVTETAPSTFPAYISASHVGTAISNTIGPIIANTDSTTGNWAGILFSDDVGGQSSALLGVKFTDHTSNYGDFAIATRSADGFSEKMRILSSGNMGVGTSAPKAKFTVVGSGAFTGTLSGSALNIQGGTSYILGNVGIGTTAPKAKIDVLGTISGSSLLTLSNYRTCTLKTSATGAVICGSDNTGGGSSFGTGNVVTIGDSKYVNIGGDTMTGALVINVTGGNINSVGLEVINTISGSVLHANTLLRSSGSLVTESGAYIDGTTLVVAAGPNRVGIGTASPKTALEVLGTISGSLITQNGAGNNYFMGKVGIGVTSPTYHLEIQDATTPRLVLQDTTNNVQMSIHATDTMGRVGTISTHGMQLLSANAVRMTINEQGNIGIGTTSPKSALHVVGSGAFTGSLSGATLSLNGTGTTSIMNYKVGIGTTSPAYKFDINGQMRAKAQFQSYVADGFDSVNGLPGITVTTPTANSRFMVAYQDAGGGQYHPAIKFLHSSTSDLAMIISEVSGDTQPYFRILDSGKMQWGPGGSTAVDTNLFRSNANVLHTDDSFTGSGLLLIKPTSVAGSGAATFVPAEFQTGAYIGGSGATALALDTYANTGSRTPHILFGYRGHFDTGLYRVGRPGSGALALRVTNTQSSNTASAFEIYSNTTHANNKVFRVAVNGATFSDGAYASTGADYAEWFMSKDNMRPGEVVCIDVTKKNTVKRCTNAADGNVMGIVSTNPSFIGNAIGGADGIMPPGYVLVGLIGQVPAKVIVEGSSGAIRPGDALTPASIAGYARKARAGESTVGVALEDLESGEGKVNVLISRRNQSLTVEAVEEKVLKTIASMEIEDEVQLMVSSALGDLNVDEQITDEVTKQIDAITAQNATIESISQDIAQMKILIASLSSSTATGAAGVVNLSDSGAVQTRDSRVSTLEIDSTLITGGSARIGGDLSIDGTLNASALFVPNGLTIDGGVVMNGVLDAQQLHVSSGATVDGVLTINGTLKLGSGTTLDFGSGALSLRQLLVEDSLFVMGDITIQGMATFLGSLNVRGEFTVSGNQAGFAMIPATGTSVTVRFGTGFTGTPVVTASPNVPVLYAVSKFSATGFTIRIAEPAAEDITFAWHALSTNTPVTIRAQLTSQGTIVFPMASDNIPVSSNMAWNACIRNITVLDDQGQPYSCGRYHESYNWTHPDLGITFIWNTSMTPPLLQLPEGYDEEVTEDAQTIFDAINGMEDSDNVGHPEELTDIGSTAPQDEPVPEEDLVPEEVPVIEPEPVIEEAPADEPVSEPVLMPEEASVPTDDPVVNIVE